MYLWYIFFGLPKISDTTTSSNAFARIVGGDRSAGADDPLVLDGSASIDPDAVAVQPEYSWSCSVFNTTIQSQSPCSVDGVEVDLNSFSVPDSPGRIRIPPSTFLPGARVTVGLTYRKLTTDVIIGNRTASTSSTLLIVPGTPPVVRLGQVTTGRKLDPNKRSIFNSSVTTTAKSTSLTWSIVSVYTPKAPRSCNKHTIFNCLHCVLSIEG